MSKKQWIDTREHIKDKVYEMLEYILSHGTNNNLDFEEVKEAYKEALSEWAHDFKKDFR